MKKDPHNTNKPSVGIHELGDQGTGLPLPSVVPTSRCWSHSVCVYIHKCVSVYVCVFVYSTQTHTHTHTHTFFAPSSGPMNLEFFFFLMEAEESRRTILPPVWLVARDQQHSFGRCTMWIPAEKRAPKPCSLCYSSRRCPLDPWTRIPFSQVGSAAGKGNTFVFQQRWSMQAAHYLT